jgi:DNA-binding winged helix-turn-helix (wHTH) protein
MKMSTELTGLGSLTARAMPQTKILDTSRYLGFGNFAVDLKREELFKDGMRVKLPGKVYQALVALLEHPGEVVSRDSLRARLWPVGTHVNYDANVNTTVNKLRLVLGDSPEKPIYVETIPRQGYSFVGSVAAVDSAGRGGQTRAGRVESANGERSPENDKARIAAASSLKWFIAGMVALVMAGMLFGAAAAFYLHRPL